jgi:dCTP diphosphatase
MKDLQKMVGDFLKARGWDERQDPANYAKSISIEAAELLELFQWNNPTAEEILNNKKLLASIKQELADVLIYCLDMASVLDLDIEKIVQEKMLYNAKKYPVKLVKNNTAAYLKQKSSYRKMKK